MFKVMLFLGANDVWILSVNSA